MKRVFLIWMVLLVVLPVVEAAVTPSRHKTSDVTRVSKQFLEIKQRTSLDLFWHFEEPAGTAKNITGADSVIFRYAPPSGGGEITVTGSVTDAANGTVKIPFSPAKTDTNTHNTAAFEFDLQVSIGSTQVLIDAWGDFVIHKRAGGGGELTLGQTWDFSTITTYLNTITNGPIQPGSGITVTTNSNGSVTFSTSGLSTNDINTEAKLEAIVTDMANILQESEIDTFAKLIGIVPFNIPDANATRDLGTSSLKFNNIYAVSNFIGSIRLHETASGDLFINSGVEIDGTFDFAGEVATNLLRLYGTGSSAMTIDNPGQSLTIGGAAASVQFGQHINLNENELQDAALEDGNGDLPTALRVIRGDVTAQKIYMGNGTGGTIEFHAGPHSSGGGSFASNTMAGFVCVWDATNQITIHSGIASDISNTRIIDIRTNITIQSTADIKAGENPLAGDTTYFVSIGSPGGTNQAYFTTNRVAESNYVHIGLAFAIYGSGDKEFAHFTQDGSGFRRTFDLVNNESTDFRVAQNVSNTDWATNDLSAWIPDVGPCRVGFMLGQDDNGSQGSFYLTPALPDVTGNQNGELSQSRNNPVNTTFSRITPNASVMTDENQDIRYKCTTGGMAVNLWINKVTVDFLEMRNN